MPSPSRPVSSQPLCTKTTRGLCVPASSRREGVFKMMNAFFWLAWVWVTEKAQDLKFTQKIFQTALRVRA